MSRIVLLSASPSAPSRTDALLEYIASKLGRHGHSTRMIIVRDLPAQPLLHADRTDPRVREAVAAVAGADAVVIGSPVYKASYSGLLKVFIDLLPMDALSGVPVLPMLTGGSPAHVLALDYGLKPLLATIGATRIAPGRFVASAEIPANTGTAPVALTAVAEDEVHRALDQFESELSPDHSESLILGRGSPPRPARGHRWQPAGRQRSGHSRGRSTHADAAQQ